MSHAGRTRVRYLVLLESYKFHICIGLYGSGASPAVLALALLCRASAVSVHRVGEGLFRRCGNAASTQAGRTLITTAGRHPAGIGRKRRARSRGAREVSSSERKQQS